MDYRLLNLSLMVLSGKGLVILLSVQPSYAFKDGKATDIIDGYKCEVCFPSMRYEKLVVKVDSKPSITQEDIDEAAEPVLVDFTEDFSAKFYKNFNNGQIGITAKAKSLVVL